MNIPDTIQCPPLVQSVPEELQEVQQSVNFTKEDLFLKTVYDDFGHEALKNFLDISCKASEVPGFDFASLKNMQTFKENFLQNINPDVCLFFKFPT